MMATSGKRGKQYGLIIRNQKSVQKTAHVSNVFGDSSDEEDVRSEVNASLAREGRRKLEAKATRELLQTAISEDPSVFEYDSVYDNIHQHKQSKTRPNTDKSRKPRYIHALLRAAEERKREQDIMFERKVQKERDAEGDMFADKEAFMTSAYREEMKRRAAMEERLRREAEQEKANDVTKQADMSRFYQHLLSQQSHHHSPATPVASSTMTTQRPSEQDKNRRMLDSHVADCITDADHITDPDHVIDSKNSLQSSEQEEEEKKDELPVDDRQQYGQQPPPRTKSHTDDDDDVPTDVSRQAQRRIAFAKRSTEATTLSARDRYLARKKAKISEPVVVVSDDDDIA